MTKDTNQVQDPHVITKLSHLQELAKNLVETFKSEVLPRTLPYLVQYTETQIRNLISFHNANFESLKAEIIADEAKKTQNAPANGNSPTETN